MVKIRDAVLINREFAHKCDHKGQVNYNLLGMVVKTPGKIA